MTDIHDPIPAKVSDEGIQQLRKLAPSLRFLELEGPSLTQAGVAKLQEAMPETAIGFGKGEEGKDGGGAGKP